MEKIDERILIEGLRTGSELSYNLLYKQWVSRLYRFVYGYVKSKSIAEDIVQETFVRIWQHRFELDSNKSFKSFLFTISYHLVLKELRRQMQNPLVEEYIKYISEVKESESDISSIVEYDQFKKALANAKKKLTPRQCEIFEMNKEYSLSVSEIAEKLAITEQVVRNQLSTSLKIIRTEMSDFSYLIYLIVLYNI